MPRPSKSTLMRPRSAQSSLSHCTTTRPGMVAGSSGTTESSCPWQTTMPPECWPRWRGKSCTARHSSRNLRMAQVETCVAELPFERIAGIAIFPGADETRQAIEGFLVKGKHFAHFARGGFTAIGDDVCGHGRAQLAIALINILNGALALIPAGEIEVDVGPFAAFLGEEALEQKVHAHGIDGGNAERIADRAIGGRTPALHENIFFAAETDDIPDDEEIAFQAELFNERQFALDLLLCAVVVRAVTPNHAVVDALAEKADLRFAGRDGIIRKAIAEIGKSEAQARGKLLGIGDGFGQVREEADHFPRRFEMAFAVPAQQAAGRGERAMVAKAGEDVEHFALARASMGNTIRGEQRQTEFCRDGNRGLIAGFFAAAEVALEFNIDVFATEDSAKLLNAAKRGAGIFVNEGVSERTFRAAGEANQTFRELPDFAWGNRAFAFRAAELHARDQAAEILVAFARFREQRIAPAAFSSDFRANMRSELTLLRGKVEAWRAI